MTDVATPSADDRSFDLSLRLLTALILVTLAGSVSFLAYRWLAPRFTQTDSGPVPTKLAPPPNTPAPAVAGSTHGDQVLMDPGRVFRCEEQGRVSFSDQACPNTPSSPGGAPATRSHPAAAAR
ncbi:MAG TPA: hypothetical protein VEK74_01085 [Burkholderiaceae bacterium]|nr:hypothetical protein [Burkholderiaceae bacterium]HYA76423.1 hypothetical protein [Burkholderiaceae bacterium]